MFVAGTKLLRATATIREISASVSGVYTNLCASTSIQSGNLEHCNYGPVADRHCKVGTFTLGPGRGARGCSGATSKLYRRTGIVCLQVAWKRCSLSPTPRLNAP